MSLPIVCRLKLLRNINIIAVCITTQSLLPDYSSSGIYGHVAAEAFHYTLRLSLPCSFCRLAGCAQQVQVFCLRSPEKVRKRILRSGAPPPSGPETAVWTVLEVPLRAQRYPQRVQRPSSGSPAHFYPDTFGIGYGDCAIYRPIWLFRSWRLSSYH